MGDLDVSKYTEQTIGLRLCNWKEKHAENFFCYNKNLNEETFSFQQEKWQESNMFWIYTSFIKATFLDYQ